jgi:hypothetical protein
MLILAVHQKKTSSKPSWRPGTGIGNDGQNPAFVVIWNPAGKKVAGLSAKPLTNGKGYT